MRGRHPFVDLALGVEGHNRRHLVPLAAARKRILSYMEAGDLMFIAALAFEGTTLLDSAKVGILSASVVSGMIGAVILRRATHNA